MLSACRFNSTTSIPHGGLTTLQVDSLRFIKIVAWVFRQVIHSSRDLSVIITIVRPKGLLTQMSHDSRRRWYWASRFLEKRTSMLTTTLPGHIPQQRFRWTERLRYSRCFAGLPSFRMSVGLRLWTGIWRWIFRRRQWFTSPAKGFDYVSDSDTWTKTVMKKHSVHTLPPVWWSFAPSARQSRRGRRKWRRRWWPWPL